jgi:large subunit ribosomal protein L18
VKLKKIINKQRQRRRYRVRNKVRGTADRPRLCIHRTLKHFSYQVIDDVQGKTLLAVSTRDKTADISYGSNCEAAQQVGRMLAEKAQAAGLKQLKLDRGSNRYHGRVAAFAEAAREAGLEF